VFEFLPLLSATYPWEEEALTAGKSIFGDYIIIVCSDYLLCSSEL
jgi:hypothetical protein